MSQYQNKTRVGLFSLRASLNLRSCFLVDIRKDERVRHWLHPSPTYSLWAQICNWKPYCSLYHMTLLRNKSTTEALTLSVLAAVMLLLWEDNIFN